MLSRIMPGRNAMMSVVGFSAIMLGIVISPHVSQRPAPPAHFSQSTSLHHTVHHTHRP